MNRHNTMLDGLGHHVNPAMLPRDDPKEALKALLTAANAHLGKQEHREALRMADEALLLARKAKDKPAEASCQLLCGQMYAVQSRWAPAFRAVETSRVLFEEMGNDEGREAAENYHHVLREAAQEAGYYEERDRRNRFQDTMGGGPFA